MTGINSGRLRNKLVISRRSVEKNNFGEQAEAFVTVVPEWRCRLVSSTGAVTEENTSVFKGQKTFHGRYRSNVEPLMYVNFLGQDLVIVDVIPDERFTTMTIVCEVENGRRNIS